MISPLLLKTLVRVGSASLPVAVALRLILYLISGSQAAEIVEKPFSAFLEDAQAGRLRSVAMGEGTWDVVTAAGAAYWTHTVPLSKQLMDTLEKHKVVFGARSHHWARRAATALLSIAGPVLYLLFMMRMVKKLQNPGGDDDGVGREGELNDSSRVTFDDVAGVDAAKGELQEIVSFLKDDSRYRAMGARLPRGVLLSGPSGTGKTLLAKATACESGVPFISCSASDFVEMLVGRGAARVRDLFVRGAASAPCIVFIDELDALAKMRGGMNSNDEREQTLNQLLTEMDGFERGGNGVIVIAATNRANVLDPALLRPGRFDRHIVVDLPDAAGRRDILEVHARGLNGDFCERDLDQVVAETDGFSGADLAEVMNYSAFSAVREGSESIEQRHMRAAVRKAKDYKQAASSTNGIMGLLETL